MDKTYFISEGRSNNFYFHQGFLMDYITPILLRIPQFASAQISEIQELSGGLTNKNYKITVDGESYVLRMGGNETKYLGIDRKIEYAALIVAALVGFWVPFGLYITLH